MTRQAGRHPRTQLSRRALAAVPRHHRHPTVLPRQEAARAHAQIDGARRQHHLGPPARLLRQTLHRLHGQDGVPEDPVT